MLARAPARITQADIYRATEERALLGLHRDVVARLVRDRRWARCGTRSVVTHCGPIDPSGLRWRAVHEVGGGALVDGVSALQAAGLRGLDDEIMHVSVHKLKRAPDVEGVEVHKVARRLCDDDMRLFRVPVGVSGAPVS